jgi:hypothetical protein
MVEGSGKEQQSRGNTMSDWVGEDEDRSLIPATIADIPKNKLAAMAKKEGDKADRLGRIAKRCKSGLFCALGTLVGVFLAAPFLAPAVFIGLAITVFTVGAGCSLGAFLIAGEADEARRLGVRFGRADREYQAGERVAAQVSSASTLQFNKPLSPAEPSVIVGPNHSTEGIEPQRKARQESPIARVPRAPSPA